MKYDCGCVAYVYAAGDPKDRTRMTRCAVHEAAPVLLAALEKIIRHCEVAATHSAISSVAEKAIRAAKGEK